MPKRSRKKEDANEIAFRVVQESVRERATKEPAPRKSTKKDPAAVALGRKGGLKGGKARAATLTQQQRSESARQAALARWKRSESND
jgi:hypothetical protein